MGDVIELRRPGETWASGPMRCLRCKHEWVYARPLPDKIVDCPACGCNAGVPAGTFGGGDDDAMWVCACGNSLLTLIVNRTGREKLLCIGCGITKEVST